MAAAKKYSVEQIVDKLREYETLQGQVLTIPQACERIGASDHNFYRWRLKNGALKKDEAQRLTALELDNAGLKRLIADQLLEISMLKTSKSQNAEARRDVGRRLSTWCSASVCRSDVPAGCSASTA
jgi:putative transposase